MSSLCGGCFDVFGREEERDAHRRKAHGEGFTDPGFCAFCPEQPKHLFDAYDHLSKCHTSRWNMILERFEMSTCIDPAFFEAQFLIARPAFLSSRIAVSMDDVLRGVDNMLNQNEDETEIPVLEHPVKEEPDVEVITLSDDDDEMEDKANAVIPAVDENELEQQHQKLTQLHSAVSQLFVSTSPRLQEQTMPASNSCVDQATSRKRPIEPTAARGHPCIAALLEGPPKRPRSIVMPQGDTTTPAMLTPVSNPPLCLFNNDDTESIKNENAFEAVHEGTGIVSIDELLKAGEEFKAEDYNDQALLTPASSIVMDSSPLVPNQMEVVDHKVHDMISPAATISRPGSHASASSNEGFGQESLRQLLESMGLPQMADMAGAIQDPVAVAEGPLVVPIAPAAAAAAAPVPVQYITRPQEDPDCAFWKGHTTSEQCPRCGVLCRGDVKRSHYIKYHYGVYFRKAQRNVADNKLHALKQFLGMQLGGEANKPRTCLHCAPTAKHVMHKGRGELLVHIINHHPAAYNRLYNGFYHYQLPIDDIPDRVVYHIIFNRPPTLC